MRLVTTGLILTFLVLSGIGQMSSAQGSGSLARADILKLCQKAEGVLASMAKKRLKVLAFCDLAAKAAPIFPRMAKDYYQQALSAALALKSREHLVLASRLKSMAKRRHFASESGQAMAYSQELERQAHTAWPLRLVAEGVLSLDPDLARQILQTGVNTCRKNPDSRRRDLDMAGLSLVLARRNRKDARGLADEISRPRIKAWAYRKLARLTQAEKDLKKALQAAGHIKEPGAKAMSLAKTAGMYYQVKEKQGAALFKRAFEEAGRVKESMRRSFVQGEVAAIAASFNARMAAKMAEQVASANGACFKAWRKVSRAMAGMGPAKSRLLLAKSESQAQGLSSDYEKNKALTLLAGDLAVLDLSAAVDIKKLLPRSMYYLRSEAETAMVLAEAGRDLGGALALAGVIEDRTCRILVLARLAAIQMNKDVKKGPAFSQMALKSEDGPVGDMARAILAPAMVVIDPKPATRLAAEISDFRIRVKTLLKVAVLLAKKGGPKAAQGVLDLALETINSGKIKQTLDKVRLLGHMGREWFELESDRARGFFETGARFAKELG